MSAPTAVPACCLVCEATADDPTAEAEGWQRGPCTCGECPTGAVWLCPEHRTDRADGAEVAA